MKRKPDFFSRLSWRLLLVLLLACLGTVGFVIWAVELGKPDGTPEEMARQALDNTVSLPVAYTSDTTLTLPDRTLEYGEVNGIQDAAGNQYLTGEILGDPVAIYYFGQDEYVQDPFTGQWRLIAKRDPLLPEAPDLSPLSNFDVSRVGSCEILETSGPFYNRVYQ